MTDLDKMAGRPAAYLAETGLPQLTSGLIFFFYGGSILAQSVLPKTFFAQEAPKWLMICFACVLAWLAKGLKQRVVFPRIGYAEPLRYGRTRVVSWVVFVAIAVSVPVLTSLGYRPHLESRLLWPGFALTFAVISLVSGRKQKSALLLWFGVYCACLAPLLWWIPGNSYYRGAWLAVGMGAPLACAGAIRLRSFLKATPVAADHPDE